jgi:hypothetical protein
VTGTPQEPIDALLAEMSKYIQAKMAPAPTTSSGRNIDRTKVSAAKIYTVADFLRQAGVEKTCVDACSLAGFPGHKPVSRLLLVWESIPTTVAPMTGLQDALKLNAGDAADLCEYFLTF